MKRVASDAPPEVRGDAKVRVEGVSQYMLQHGQPFAVLQEVNLYAQAGEWSCPCSLRLIQQPDKLGKMPSFLHVCEGVLPWYLIFSSISSR